jgi:hypothetical protein
VIVDDLLNVAYAELAIGSHFCYLLSQMSHQSMRKLL